MFPNVHTTVVRARVPFAHAVSADNSENINQFQLMKTHSLIRCLVPAILLLAGTAGSFAQTLTITNGLQLWLRADAGVTTNAGGGVTQWLDQSTNANNAVQPTDIAAPVLVNGALNSRPVLRFDGGDDFLDVADAASLSGTGDVASFFVVRFETFGGRYNAVWAKTVNNLPAPTDIYTQPGSGELTVFRGDGTLNNLTPVSSAPLRENAYLVLGFDVSGSTLTHYVNNQPNGSGVVTLNTADGNTPLKIGTRGDGFTRLRGDLAELLIFDRALSASERTNVFTYLQTKYNLLNLTPNISLATVPAGPNVSVGDVVTLNATASDPDGTVVRVDFLANGVIVATATRPPFSARVTIGSAGSIQFTARATDDKGGIANSAPVNLTAGPAGPTTLPVTSGLQLWLKADAGTTLGLNGGVVQWSDQSGNGNNALQINETLAPIFTNGAVNGQPALRFDGVDDFLEVLDSDSISITNDITTLFIARFADFAAGTFKAIWGKTLVNQPAPTDIYVPSSGRLTFFRGNGTVNGSVVATQPFAVGTYLLGEVEMGGTAVRHYYNGALNGSGTITAPIADANGTLRVGSRADGVTKMKGEIAEILIFNRTLSTADRLSVERYLAEKYAVATLSLTNTPPVVAITSPAGEVLQAPGSATVGASASDSDGSIVSVQFFANGVSLGTDNAAPFGTNLNLTYGGVVTLSARATDNLGMQSVSPAMQVCVQGPGAPLGLVSYWPLDGNANALVGTSGTLVGGPVAAPDRNSVAGGALAFDGTLSQRVQIAGGGGLNNAQRGTISMWVKWAGTQDGDCCGTFGAVLSRQQDGAFSDNIISLSTADPNTAVVRWRQTSAGTVNITGTGIVGNDVWRHIIVTFTETNSELFVDGFSEGIGSGGVLHNNAATALAIGAWAAGGGGFATAAIDDVAIWNRVLTSTEVQALAAQERTPMTLLIAPDCPSIERNGNNVTVRWGSQSILQSATEVSGPYADVIDPLAPPPGFVTSPYATTASDPRRYYRLRSP